MKNADLKRLFLTSLKTEFAQRFGLRKRSLGYSKMASSDVEAELGVSVRSWPKGGLEIGMTVSVRSLRVSRELAELGVLSRLPGAASLAKSAGYLSKADRSKHWDVDTPAEIDPVVADICEFVEANVVPFWAMCTDMAACLAAIDSYPRRFTNQEYVIPVTLFLMGKYEKAREALNHYFEKGGGSEYAPFREAVFRRISERESGA